MQKKVKHIENILERTVFVSRWILAPFYLGLSLSLLVLLHQFIKEIYVFVTDLTNTSIESVLLFVLTLVDISLSWKFAHHCYFLWV